MGNAATPALHHAALLSVLDNVYKARTPHMNNTSRPQGSPAPIPQKALQAPDTKPQIPAPTQGNTRHCICLPEAFDRMHATHHKQSSALGT